MNVSDIVYGEDAIVDIIVIGVDGKPVPTGTVTVMVDGFEIDRVTLVDGHSSCSVSDLSVGEHLVVIRYNGDDYYSALVEIGAFNVSKFNPSIYLDVDEINDFKEINKFENIEEKVESKPKTNIEKLKLDLEKAKKIERIIYHE